MLLLDISTDVTGIVWKCDVLEKGLERGGLDLSSRALYIGESVATVSKQSASIPSITVSAAEGELSGTSQIIYIVLQPLNLPQAKDGRLL